MPATSGDGPKSLNDNDNNDNNRNNDNTNNEHNDENDNTYIYIYIYVHMHMYLFICTIAESLARNRLIRYPLVQVPVQPAHRAHPVPLQLVFTVTGDPRNPKDLTRVAYREIGFCNGEIDEIW